MRKQKQSGLDRITREKTDRISNDSPAEIPGRGEASTEPGFASTGPIKITFMDLNVD